MDIRVGYYRHYKGKMYRVLFTAVHTETKERYVVYEAQDENAPVKYWVRPETMFSETVTVKGKRIARFQYVGP
jgi:hypothetical protein